MKNPGSEVWTLPTSRIVPAHFATGASFSHLQISEAFGYDAGPGANIVEEHGYGGWAVKIHHISRILFSSFSAQLILCLVNLQDNARN